MITPMPEILLVRHAKSFANARDFTAFGNRESPLMEKGVRQARNLRRLFKDEYDILPEQYTSPVYSSEFTRTQETAKYAGFCHIKISGVINESDLESERIGGTYAVSKHAREKWAPDETMERATRFIQLVRDGKLEGSIFFTHGLFIAATMLHLSEEAQINGHAFPHQFHQTRGYIPRLASINPLDI